MPERRSVLVAFLHPGEWTGEFGQSLLSTIARAEGRFIGGILPWPSGPALDISRDQVADRFLASALDWLLFLDSDMEWEPDDLLAFVGRYIQQLPAPNMVRVVSGAYLRVGWDGPDGLTASMPNGSDARWEAGKLFKVAAVGAGALMIHRSVLETLGPGPFSTTGPGMREDLSFCARCHQAGIEVWLDCGFELGHAKRHVWWPSKASK